MKLSQFNRQPYWVRFLLGFALGMFLLLIIGWLFSGFESGYFTMGQLLADTVASLFFSWIFATSFRKNIYCSFDKRPAIVAFLQENGYNAVETSGKQQIFRNLEGQAVTLSEKNGLLLVESPKYLAKELEALNLGTD